MIFQVATTNYDHYDTNPNTQLCSYHRITSSYIYTMVQVSGHHAMLATEVRLTSMYVV